MRNHYHLALETPQANLVAGMHWLQSTFSTRFNRFRQERGHLCQGRYQAILVETLAGLAGVVDYIHLNPVRAGIVETAQLAGFRWSSLRKFMRGPRQASLVAEDFLAQRGLQDSEAGWASYLGELQALAVDEAEQERRGFKTMSKGWAIGTRGWRHALIKDNAQRALDPGLERAELWEFREARWADVLTKSLRAVGRMIEEAAAEPKRADWKLRVMRELRAEGVPYRWIAEKLHMGSPAVLRVYVSRQKTY
jgi:putative transposase